jgi:transcriptional regulator with XRE-family HTH domain
MAKAGLDERSSRVHKRGSRYRREAKTLGARLRSLRQSNGWTLEQTAERCDLDQKHLQKIESGQLNVTLVTLVRLSVGFQQPIATLFEQASTKRATKRAR